MVRVISHIQGRQLEITFNRISPQLNELTTEGNVSPLCT